MWVRSLGQEDPLGEGMAIHSSTLAWRKPIDRGAWQGTAHKDAKRWTQLKRLRRQHTQLMVTAFQSPCLI